VKPDWRLQGQEKYLLGTTLYWRSYTKYRDGWDHDHCEFCRVTFMEEHGPEILTEGYSTKDGYRWICKRCFDDFRCLFKFALGYENAD
jgi:hypothetical protein